MKPHVLQCCNVAMSQCPGVRDVRVPATALAVIKDNRNPPDQTPDRVAAFSSWADFFKKSGAGGYQPSSSGLGLVLANKKTTPSPAQSDTIPEPPQRQRPRMIGPGRRTGGRRTPRQLDLSSCTFRQLIGPSIFKLGRHRTMAHSFLLWKQTFRKRRDGNR